MSLINAIENFHNNAFRLSKEDNTKGDTTILKLNIINKLVKVLMDKADYYLFHNLIYNTLTLPWDGYSLNSNKLTNIDTLNLNDADKQLSIETKNIITEYLNQLNLY